MKWNKGEMLTQMKSILQEYSGGRVKYHLGGLRKAPYKGYTERGRQRKRHARNERDRSQKKRYPDPKEQSMSKGGHLGSEF